MNLRAKSPAASRLGLRIHALCYVLANLVQIGVWWYWDSDHFFWPLWSIVFWGAGLLIHYWTVKPGRDT